MWCGGGSSERLDLAQTDRKQVWENRRWIYCEIQPGWLLEWSLYFCLQWVQPVTQVCDPTTVETICKKREKKRVIGYLRIHTYLHVFDAKAERETWSLFVLDGGSPVRADGRRRIDGFLNASWATSWFPASATQQKQLQSFCLHAFLFMLLPKLSPTRFNTNEYNLSDDIKQQKASSAPWWFKFNYLVFFNSILFSFLWQQSEILAVKVLGRREMSHLNHNTKEIKRKIFQFGDCWWLRTLVLLKVSLRSHCSGWQNLETDKEGSDNPSIGLFVRLQGFFAECKITKAWKRRLVKDRQ